MNAPFNLAKGNILLLSNPESFSAAYLKRSLNMFGISVIAPDGPPEHGLASLDAAEWLSISACVAIDLSQALFDMLAAQRYEVPFIFIGRNPRDWFSPHGWLTPPFAAFQVVEMLGQMVAAATATMQASLDSAAADMSDSSLRC